MRIRVLLLPALAMAMALFAGPVAADPPRAAMRLYTEGDFLAAADRAELQPGSVSLAFAARALMAACVTNPDAANLDRWLNRAESAAHESLELDPTSVEARLQLALTLGVRSRRASIAQAVTHRYAPRGRRLIEEALRREPNNAWAHALLGGWHLEVLRRGGHTGATLYGAREERGFAEFERARALAPNDPMIALHYAIALLEFDSDTYAARAGVLLADARRHPPRDAFEAHTLAAAADVAEALARSGPAAAEAVAQNAFR